MDYTIDAIYGMALYRLDREYWEARAIAADDVQAELDVKHNARIAAMDACTTIEDLQALVDQSWR